MKIIQLCKKCGGCPVVVEFDDGRKAIMEDRDETIIYFDEEQWDNLRTYFLSKEAKE